MCGEIQFLLAMFPLESDWGIQRDYDKLPLQSCSHFLSFYAASFHIRFEGNRRDESPGKTVDIVSRCPKRLVGRSRGHDHIRHGTIERTHSKECNG